MSKYVANCARCGSRAYETRYERQVHPYVVMCSNKDCLSHDLVTSADSPRDARVIWNLHQLLKNSRDEEDK